jgi:hypothetical protein
MTKQIFMGEQFKSLFPNVEVEGNKIIKPYDAILVVEVEGKKFAYNLGKSKNTSQIINQIGVMLMFTLSTVLFINTGMIMINTIFLFQLSMRLMKEF